MANISAFLGKILSAVYGEEVRGSIHDALEAMNAESSSAMEFASTAKDSAQSSAAAAGRSANAASQKAAEAAASAGAARTSETNAKTSETNTSAKAAEASASAAQAKSSETAAVQKAQEAAASQAAAARSEAQALSAKERAEAMGAQAAEDKTAAENAKTAAEAARDAAAVSRTEAKNSENTALTAKTAAEAAKNSAEAAKLDADAARTAAEASAKSAGTDASDAAKAADAAAASALSAQQYSGKPPKPQNGTWWLWDAAQQTYVDSGIGCELTGPAGNGVASIVLTSGDHTPGTVDIYTVTMTDGTTLEIPVHNGWNGTGSGDVRGIVFDLVLPAADWEDGRLTVSDSRLLALSVYKYFVDADADSREEFLDCNVRPGDITETGSMTFLSDAVPGGDLTVNVIRLELAVNGT